MTVFTKADALRLISADRTSCTIPDTFTSIAVNAFQLEHITDFPLLYTVIIPNTITSIGNYAFVNLTISSITIPPSVIQISAYAFGNCSSLKSVTISDATLNNNNYGMNRWGSFNDPFYGCTLLIAKAQSLNMTVKQYLLHRNERIRLRVTVLSSLKAIQNARDLSAETDGREFVWGDGIAIEGG